MSLRPFFYTLLLFSPLAASAVEPPITINDDSGCRMGQAATVAKSFCTNFDVGDMSKRDWQVAQARKSCEIFYEAALRLQNTFCSYQKDAVIFEKVAATTVEAKIVGEQNVSEEAVSHDNYNAAKMGRAYMARIAVLATDFKKKYGDYIAALGKLNAAAGSDTLYEAMCSAQNVHSEVPGYFRELLVNYVWAAGNITYDSMWNATRKNYVSLKAMKEEAEKNAQLAQVRGIQAGSVLTQPDLPKTEKDNTIVLPSANSAGNPVVQYAATKVTEQLAQHLTTKYVAEYAGIIGCGAILAFQYESKQAVQVPETAACLVSLASPEISLALGVLIAQARHTQQVVKIYRDFSLEQLSDKSGGKFNIKAMDLVTEWGKRTKQDSCVKAAAAEQDCIYKRATMKPYEVNNCTPSPLDGREPPGWQIDTPVNQRHPISPQAAPTITEPPSAQPDPTPIIDGAKK
jgi:hypothetical protein